jgi:hypothetical protein
MTMFIPKHFTWWYWLAADLLLLYGLAGGEWGFAPVIALCAAQALHFIVRERSLSAFPVQVRVSYLGLLLFGLWEYGHFIYWIQLAGTSAMVLADYCPLARFLSLMPWNRRESFSWKLLVRTFLSRPVRGSILQGLPPA